MRITCRTRIIAPVAILQKVHYHKRKPSQRPGNKEMRALQRLSRPLRHRCVTLGMIIVSTPTPQNGCFVTSFPSTEQKEVPCATAAPEEATVRRPAIIGNLASDYILLPKPNSTITRLDGSFANLSDVLTETGVPRGTPATQDTYTIQINSNLSPPGVPAICARAAVPANCIGWQQFVYSSSLQQAYIEYWLFHYTSAAVSCPSGWHEAD